jgi:hypothetical protein
MAEYIILAYSPSTGHVQRELQLESRPASDPRLAQMFADSFAARLNAAGMDGIKDWVPRLELVNPDSHVRTG